MYVCVNFVCTAVSSDTTQWPVGSPKEWRKISVWLWRGRCRAVERTCSACFTASASTRKSSSSSLSLDTWPVTFKPFRSRYFGNSWTDFMTPSAVSQHRTHFYLSCLRHPSLNCSKKKKSPCLKRGSISSGVGKYMSSCSFHGMCVVSCA